MKLTAAAIQMLRAVSTTPGQPDRADRLLRRAHEAGAELAVLPEMFNTGYGLCPDYRPLRRDPRRARRSGTSARSRQWDMTIAAGFVEQEGMHVYDSLALVTPDGAGPRLPQAPPGLLGAVRGSVRAASPLVVATPWGRVGFAICADMIYRKVWHGYRDRIDLAIIAAAWPDFADRETGREALAARPRRPALGVDSRPGCPGPGNPGGLRQPVRRDDGRAFRSSARIADRFAGQSSVCDGRHGPPGPRRGRRGRCSELRHGPPPARIEIVAYYVPLGPRGILLRIGTFTDRRPRQADLLASQPPPRSRLVQGSPPRDALERRSYCLGFKVRTGRGWETERCPGLLEHLVFSVFVRS